MLRANRTDIGPDDAPTRLVCGSHLHVPEFLAPYGEAGTALVHTVTWPHRGRAPRMIAQPAVHVRDGFALDGSDPSPVARAIVTGLAMAERS